MVGYPKAIYKTGEDVLIGDHVEFRVWIELWLRKHHGRVIYVPGISPPSETLECNGLKWISVEYEGTFLGPLVDPESGIVKDISLVQRSNDGLTETPEDYEFRDEYERSLTTSSRGTAKGRPSAVTL